MRPFASLLPSLIAFLFAAGTPAQDLASTIDEQAELSPPADLQFLLPLHKPCEDERQGEELWAVAIPGWKARFDDGLTFYSAVQASGTNPSTFAWRSLALRVGGRSLRLDGTRAQRSHTDKQYTLDYGPVVEQYDISMAGVEQSFVIKVAPEDLGDLVIEGEVTTFLRPDIVEDTHADVVYRDSEDHAIVTYGKASVTDALGQSAEVSTTVRRGRIELRVSAEWLAVARYPVTIDPLIGPGTLGVPWSVQCAPCTNLSSHPHVCTGPRVVKLVSRHRNLPNSLLVVVEFPLPNLLSDVYAFATTPTWQNPIPVFSRLTGVARAPSAAYSYANTDRWIIAWEQYASVTDPAPQLGIYSQRGDDPSANAGVMRIGFQIGTPSGLYNTYRRPVVGGTFAGSHALVVAEAQDPTHPYSNSQIAWFEINCVDTQYTNMLRYADIADEQPLVSRGHLAINAQNYDDADPWLIAWEQSWTLGGRNRFIVASAKDLYSAFGPMVTVGDLNDPRVQHSPKVEGRQGNFVVAYSVATNTNSEIWAARLLGSAGSATVVDRNLLVATGNVQDLAWDLSTGAQFAMVFDTTHGQEAMTFGLRLIPFETVQIPDSLMSKIAYDGAVGVFPIVSGRFASAGFGLSLCWCYGCTLYDPANPLVCLILDGTVRPCPNPSALNPSVSWSGYVLTRTGAGMTTWGAGCGAAGLRARGFTGTSLPLELSGGPPNAPAVMFLSTTPIVPFVDLTFLGMPNCKLHVGPLVDIAMTTNASGVAVVNLPLVFPVGFELYAQAPYFNPGANALGIELTPAYRLSIQ